MSVCKFIFKRELLLLNCCCSWKSDQPMQSMISPQPSSSGFWVSSASAVQCTDLRLSGLGPSLWSLVVSFLWSQPQLSPSPGWPLLASLPRYQAHLSRPGSVTATKIKQVFSYWSDPHHSASHCTDSDLLSPWSSLVHLEPGLSYWPMRGGDTWQHDFINSHCWEGACRATVITGLQDDTPQISLKFKNLRNGNDFQSDNETSPLIFGAKFSETVQLLSSHFS